MDLSKISQMTNQELTTARNNLATNLLRPQKPEFLSSIIISLTIVLHQQLKLEFLKYIKKSEKKYKEDDPIFINGSYELVLKYVNYWNSVSALFNFVCKARGEITSIPDNHFYDTLKANNPFVYSIFINALNSVGEGKTEIKL